MVRWRSLLPALAVSVVLPACARGGKSAPGGTRPAVAVETALAVSGDLRETIDVVGTLTPKFQADVKAEYSGIVADVLVTEWVRVTKGTILLRFDAREAEASLEAARAGVLQAEAAGSRARRELERSQKLLDAGLATRQSLDDQATAAEAAAAQVAVAKAQAKIAETRLAKTVITAPMDGTVSSRTVNPGDFIENMGSPKPMFRIVDNRRLDLTVTVPSSRTDAVKLGQALTFTTDALPGRTFSGKVAFINPAAEEASRTVRVVVEVDNSGGALKGGFFVKGQIVTGDRRGVLRVPRGAFVTWDLAARKAVLFSLEGDRAVRREVTTGASSGEDVEIVTGLTQGQRVVTRGGFNLQDGDRALVVAPKKA